MSVPDRPAFHEWVREQLKTRKITQRQLAERSGVHHSTISRVVAGRNSVNLDTAIRVLRALGVSTDESRTPYPFGRVPRSRLHPTAFVEHALRSDSALTDPQVRQIMNFYLGVRRRASLRRVGSQGPHGDERTPQRDG